MMVGIHIWDISLNQSRLAFHVYIYAISQGMLLFINTPPHPDYRGQNPTLGYTRQDSEGHGPQLFHVCRMPLYFGARSLHLDFCAFANIIAYMLLQVCQTQALFKYPQIIFSRV